MSNSLLESFLGALQASLAVLLTIFYGVLAAQFQLIDHPSAKKVSNVCVRLFLPALLITKVGSELHSETAERYVPVLIWSLFYTLTSMGFGILATKMFKLPTWVTPAVCFNNTTSLPLLLIEALEATGILQKLLQPDESVSQAIKRAESYFLVCAIVGNCLTFAIGPRLIDAEHAPEKEEEPQKNDTSDEDDHQVQNGDVEQGGGQPPNDEEESTERTSLLPDRLIEAEQAVSKRVSPPAHRFWNAMPPMLREFFSLLGDLFNAPLIGALIGAIIGLSPPLHQAFFSTTQAGGILNAWLTSSMQNVGNLFASLQTVIVGVNLSSSLRKMKRGEEGGSVPWVPMLFVLFIRFVVWPAISISVIYGLATKTNLLGDDPILWFAMMLMPTGPSAMKVLVMADVNGADEEEMMSISKFLTISYAISPIICFAVVGSLTASEAALK